MELKFVFNISVFSFKKRFNRTRMELKYTARYNTQHKTPRFNRTRMELKLLNLLCFYLL